MARQKHSSLYKKVIYQMSEPIASAIPVGDVYKLRLLVGDLRRKVFGQHLPENDPALEELVSTEIVLQEAEAAAIKPNQEILLDNRNVTHLLGPKTTGLQAVVKLRMAQVPTSTYHLFDPSETPLVSCHVRNTGRGEDKSDRRIRVSSYIEGYSARAIDTVELPYNAKHDFKQLPTLFPSAMRNLNELTRATLNILVEDLDGKVEIHKTHPLWLLARTTAPLEVRDPANPAEPKDMTRYFGAYVTPNALSVRDFLVSVADQHPERALRGYQGADAGKVREQVDAIYKALQKLPMAYVHSVIQFSPEEGGGFSQRVRLPRESLRGKTANCIDLCVLFASLMEAISLHPMLVVVPGHTFIGWEEADGNEKWSYLETTMLNTHPFEVACAAADAMAKRYKKQDEGKQTGLLFRSLPLRTLRNDYKIFPME